MYKWKVSYDLSSWEGSADTYAEAWEKAYSHVARIQPFPNDSIINGLDRVRVEFFEGGPVDLTSDLHRVQECVMEMPTWRNEMNCSAPEAVAEVLRRMDLDGESCARIQLGNRQYVLTEITQLVED